MRAGHALRNGPPLVAGDAGEYHEYATSLVSTHRYEAADGRVAGRMPAYPAFLAAVYRLAGPSPSAAQAVQVLLGALACLALFLLASRLFEPPWPLALGLAAAVAHDLAAPTAQLLSECLYASLLSGALAALYWDGWTPVRRAATAALGLALAYMTRAEVLPAALLVLAGLPLWSRGLKTRHAALGLAVFLAPAAAWSLRSTAALGRVTIASSTAGFNRYLGLRLPAEALGRAEGPRVEVPAGLGDLERDDIYARAADELKAKLPLRTRLKCYAYNLASTYYPFLPHYDWTYAALLPFALLGLLLSVRRRELVPFALLVLGPSAAYAVLAGPVSRYRFAFFPCLLVLGFAGAREVARRVRDERRLAWGLGGWLGANLLLWALAPQARGIALSARAILFGR